MTARNVDISLSWRFKVYGSDGELIRSRGNNWSFVSWKIQIFFF